MLRYINSTVLSVFSVGKPEVIKAVNCAVHDICAVVIILHSLWAFHVYETAQYPAIYICNCRKMKFLLNFIIIQGESRCHLELIFNKLTNPEHSTWLVPVEAAKTDKTFN